ncbi:MAG: hypothetical protein V2I45_00660, partial [Halieaceae bacterium]|nr:hypothetical protein [Halieaceae bacterium]
MKATSVGSRMIALGSNILRDLHRFLSPLPHRGIALYALLLCLSASPNTLKAELLRGESWELGVPTNGRSEFLTG